MLRVSALLHLTRLGEHNSHLHHGDAIRTTGPGCKEVATALVLLAAAVPMFGCASYCVRPRVFLFGPVAAPPERSIKSRRNTVTSF